MFETSISIAPKQQSRGGSIASLVLHGALLTMLFAIATPEAIQRHYHSTPLYLPMNAASPARPYHVIPTKRVGAPRLTPKLAILPAVRSFVPGGLVLPEAPVISMPPDPPVNALSLVPAAPPITVAPTKPEIRAGAFESNSTPATRTSDTTMKPQAAGFDSTAMQPAKTPRSGVIGGVSFGAVADTLATRAQRGEIASTQFDAVTARAAPRTAANVHSGLGSPLEIVFKPRPLYTAEARRLHIEGDVVLQVVFRASAQACVLRVLRGLGHGLDESAVSAASAIRFRPATDGEQPIDDVATVTIKFQLAD